MKKLEKLEFMRLTGEDPVDVLGNDWENLIEEYQDAETIITHLEDTNER